MGIHAGAVAPLLVAGTALNGVLHMPHALRLAYGWTRLDLAIGLTMLILLIPSIIFSAQRYGGVGTASAWVLLNIAALFITVPLTHGRLLQDDKRSWILVDTLAPWVAAAAAVWIVWFFLGDLLQTHPIASIPMLGLLAVIVAGLTLPDIRHRILQVFARSSPAQI